MASFLRTAATAAPRRSLASSALSFARKPAASSANAGAMSALEVLRAEMVENQSTPYRGDGITKYHADLVSAAVEVRAYLEKVHHELPLLQSVMQPAPFVAPSPRAYLRFRVVDHLGDDTHPMNSKVSLTVAVDEVVAAESLTDAQRHTLLLLAGSRYDPLANTITLADSRFPHRAQNKRWLADTFATLIHTVKTTEASFAEVPVDLRHAARKIKAAERKQRLRFPDEWKIRAPEVAATAAPAEATATPTAAQ
ncbi:mitochondrial ribosomal subunit protein-domain-containing protein [Blastocladiella britannica]|nr:mitochondrial ribosomal subunit protein-domain-containing protein [Blastocladiella britannica]